MQPLGGSEDDIEEFIKRHLADEDARSATKTEEEKAMLLAKAREMLGEDKVPGGSHKDEEADVMEESLTDSDGSADMDSE